MHDDLRARIAAGFPRTRAELESLIRIPSVSAGGFDPADVRRSALATAQLMRDSGLRDVRLLEVEGAHPAVLGERRTGDERPTVLLYAHHDVQPPGDLAQWTSDPFQPAERDGRLFGRGASDDKAGIAIHLAALRALGDDLPVNVKLFVEGEEEIGSLHLADFLTRYAADLAADVIVIADSANWRVGEPALTTTLRGLVDCEVEVRTLRQGVPQRPLRRRAPGCPDGPRPRARVAPRRRRTARRRRSGLPRIGRAETSPRRSCAIRRARRRKPA